MDQEERDAQEIFKMLNIEVKITASGHKSSEGDGRTAADIEKELEEKNGS